MKLLILSDLHCDNNHQRLGKSIVPAVSSYIREVAPDRVLVAGDMAGGADRCIRYIEELEQNSGVALSYIPGNHSIWTDKRTDSWHEYEKLRDHHSSLIGKPLLLGTDWAVIGDMGWYDYTYREDSWSREECVSRKESYWRDAAFARWGMEDEEVTDRMLDSFRTQLEAHRDRRVVFVNHFIPYDDYVPISPRNKVWNMIRPFMGSSRIGDLLDDMPHVEHVIFGHVHYRFGTKRRGDKLVHCHPLGYTSEWQSQQIEKEIRSASCVIKL
ncbi:metallophosphoesterase family protein [Tumebacillus sp. ITR2]|uniref:Metallophosphoesterase family protein n=1 Tax=Tumebacillus amylolyticus TaxID=2801339 RepID=A0ABS1JBW0_9BACL|nr:metallophosphoesterase [Tumebacillus amylolyticus]MBL0387760.1 metallophosphoesterase family protein [Tumebacillus amylolyticus]